MPIITSGRLRDFDYMSNQYIGTLCSTWGWTTNPQKIMVTVINRLAWLIKKMEQTPSDMTTSASKWYLDHIDGHAPLPRGHANFTAPYIERLRRAIAAYETRMGYQVSPDQFGRLAGNGEFNIRWVLYGPPDTYSSEATMPSVSTPLGVLALVIKQDCWRSGLNN